jgi:hypothetical protein
VNAQKRYSEFAQAGIGNPSIWADLQAQSLLGVEGFADGLRHLAQRPTIRRAAEFGEANIPRPGKVSRTSSAEAITEYGYSQKGGGRSPGPELFDDQPNPHSRQSVKRANVKDPNRLPGDEAEHNWTDLVQ